MAILFPVIGYPDAPGSAARLPARSSDQDGPGTKRMTKKVSFRLVLTVLATLSLATPAQAREPAAAGQRGGFDYYLLSLSLAPSFAHSPPPTRHRTNAGG
jgi:ribonuclease I